MTHFQAIINSLSTFSTLGFEKNAQKMFKEVVWNCLCHWFQIYAFDQFLNTNLIYSDVALMNYSYIALKYTLPVAS